MVVKSKRVRLVGVLGDQIEFADLLGLYGILVIQENRKATFNPYGHGHWIAMWAENIQKTDNEIIVETKMKNTFIFLFAER